MRIKGRTHASYQRLIVNKLKYLDKTSGISILEQKPPHISHHISRLIQGSIGWVKLLNYCLPM